MKKLTKRQLQKLISTPFDNLVREFPKSQFGFSRRQLVEIKNKALAKRKEVVPPDFDELQFEVQEDRRITKLSAEHNSLKRKYAELIKTVEAVEKEKEAILAISQPVNVHKIESKVSEGPGSEGVAVVVASDWHVEEKVDPKVVSGLNEYNTTIARKSADSFFQTVLRLIQIESSATQIKTLVLALLGDFFSNDIHEELVETAELLPMDAVMLAQELLASGIRFLLDNSELELVIPCHSGNHGRTTERVHISTEKGHSLEFFMYNNLKKIFEKEPRVKFLIADGYHSYLDVFGTMLRFHHGHHVRYAGGVGGITIPVKKAIANWNKARWADIDVFGHFHQLFDGGNFICNGSLIGYNAYALSIKAEYERPQQAFFLIHKRLGKILTRNIIPESRKFKRGGD